MFCETKLENCGLISYSLILIIPLHLFKHQYINYLKTSTTVSSVEHTEMPFHPSSGLGINFLQITVVELFYFHISEYSLYAPVTEMRIIWMLSKTWKFICSFRFLKTILRPEMQMKKWPNFALALLKSICTQLFLVYVRCIWMF